MVINYIYYLINLLFNFRINLQLLISVFLNILSKKLEIS